MKKRYGVGGRRSRIKDRVIARKAILDPRPSILIHLRQRDLENCSMARLNSGARSTMRANRVEVEKINVPQAEIRTAGVIIALKTLNECTAFCMALNQSVNPLGEFKILLGQSANAMGHHAQTYLVP